MHQQLTAFENIVGKGEIAHEEQLLLFLQCFLLNQVIFSPFVHSFDIISLFASEFAQPKVGISGKGLKNRHKMCSSQISMGANKIMTARHEATEVAWLCV